MTHAEKWKRLGEIRERCKVLGQELRNLQDEETELLMLRTPGDGPRCKHGTLVDHCPDCAPDPEEIERNEKQQAERRPGSSGGTY